MESVWFFRESFDEGKFGVCSLGTSALGVLENRIDCNNSSKPQIIATACTGALHQGKIACQYLGSENYDTHRNYKEEMIGEL